ncbi:uncharacterized protein LOC143823488 [Paroedura picta]|uniref:uncharacterized protein LOC143823488 n=1 Tax=Paroedura picta TaxID=143630 RepID=UPI0040561264
MRGGQQRRLPRGGGRTGGRLPRLLLPSSGGPGSAESSPSPAPAPPDGRRAAAAAAAVVAAEAPSGKARRRRRLWPELPRPPPAEHTKASPPPFAASPALSSAPAPCRPPPIGGRRAPPQPMAAQSVSCHPKAEAGGGEVGKRQVERGEASSSAAAAVDGAPRLASLPAPLEKKVRQRGPGAKAAARMAQMWEALLKFSPGPQLRPSPNSESEEAVKKESSYLEEEGKEETVQYVGLLLLWRFQPAAVRSSE